MAVEITPEIDAFLRQVHIARIATVRPDGRPHVAPIWYLWHDGAMYFETMYSTVKGKNLKAYPYLAVTVDVTGGGMRNKLVVLEGKVELIEDKDEVRRITEQIYIRYLGKEGLLAPTPQEMLKTDKMVIKLVPEHVFHDDTLEPPFMAAL
ncbi:MAG: PPOX class F420-dependent oxidoreductase [Anaerolineae bacterium]|nr:PPOX class F420-dependent oxidoreductase [Anaerolineae bacterium]